jgi:hypothetical protein
LEPGDINWRYRLRIKTVVRLWGIHVLDYEVSNELPQLVEALHHHGGKPVCSLAQERNYLRGINMVTKGAK